MQTDLQNSFTMISEDILYTYVIKIFHLILSMFLHYLANLAVDFNGTLHVGPQNSYSKI